MASLRNSLALVLVLFPVACGGGAEGESTPASSAQSDSPKGDRPNPLVSLTATRFDDYLAVLNEAAADPDRDDVEVALARDWKIGDWVFLHASVNSVVKAGGFDEYLERMRTKMVDVSRQIEEYEAQVDGAPEAQREQIQNAAATLRRAVEGWERTLAQADAMRAGGELVEGRMADIKAATE